MYTITILDKQFSDFIANQDIVSAAKRIAMQIQFDYKGRIPFFVVVLNGGFMFAAEIFKHFHEPCQISFVKLSSYDGTRSNDKVIELIGLSENIHGRDVVILEDIVDTGATLTRLLVSLTEAGAASARIASLLFKPGAFRGNFRVDYTGFEVPDDFVVGFGLDYSGFGRNLPGIYKMVI